MCNTPAGVALPSRAAVFIPRQRAPLARGAAAIPARTRASAPSHASSPRASVHSASGMWTHVTPGSPGAIKSSNQRGRGRGHCCQPFAYVHTRLHSSSRSFPGVSGKLLVVAQASAVPPWAPFTLWLSKILLAFHISAKICPGVASFTSL